MRIPKKSQRRWWTITVSALVVIGISWLIHAHLDDLSREAIMRHGRDLPPAGFVAAFLILPLLGFPISILLVLAGLRFGLGVGMVLVSGGMIFHHFAAYHLAHGGFREWVIQRLKRAGYTIPTIKSKHRIWFTAVFAAIHGPPYVVKLYLLALTNIPFRIYCSVGAPVYIIFGLIPVSAGSAIVHLDANWIYLFIGISFALLFVAYYLQRRVAKDPLD